MMKICIISFYSPQNSVGGLERYLDTIMKELDKRKHSVHFVTAAYGKDEIEKVGNITFHKLKAMSSRVRDKDKASKNFYSYLKKLIKKEGIDIICAENFYRKLYPGYTFAINLASMETKTPVILRVHNYVKNKFEEAMIKNLFWDKICPVSKNVTNSLYDFGVNIEKLSTVYMPINTEIFKPNGKDWLRSRIDVRQKDTVLLHASRITGSKKVDWMEEKGVYTLLKAFSIVSQHHKDLKLLIAAAMPPPIWKKDYEKACKKIQELVELNGIKDKVIV